MLALSLFRLSNSRSDLNRITTGCPTGYFRSGIASPVSDDTLLKFFFDSVPRFSINVDPLILADFDVCRPRAQKKSVLWNDNIGVLV